MEHRLFIDIIYILFLSAVTLFICNRLHIPTIVGFLLVGILEGPEGFSIVHSVAEVEKIAEIGVVFLMFTIGIEFSFESLLRIKRLLFAGGSLQTMGTFLVSLGILLPAGLPLPKTIFIALLATLSSTAIVLRALQKRGEIDTPHGRTSVGILIFQDLLVIPMMLSVPLLAGAADITFREALPFLMKAALFVALIIISAKWIFPTVLHQIARTRDTELFFISIILFVFAVAYATYSIGLSLALGAFLAGLIISNSQYGQRALSNILPLRDIFMSFFFVSVGMLLNPGTLAAAPVLVAGGTLLLIILKMLIVTGTALILGLPLRSALLSGFALAQVGEFGFVLASAGLGAGLLDIKYFQIFLGVSILSMLATPFLIAQGSRIADIFMRFPFPQRIMAGTYADDPAPQLVDHLVIIGFGLGGKHIADAAEAVKIPYVVIEANPDTVRTERAAGRLIYHGDATAESILLHAGIPDARVAVVTMSDPVGTNRVVEQIRLLNPSIYIIVRIRYFSQAETLLALGADEAVPEEYEASLEIFTRVLHKYLVPKEEIEDMVSAIRAEGYHMLRSPSTAKPALHDLETLFSGMEVRVIRIHEASNAIGRSLAELNLRKDYGITVLAISRREERHQLPDGNMRFEPGDQVVLLGMPELLLFADAIFKSHHDTI